MNDWLKTLFKPVSKNKEKKSLPHKIILTYQAVRLNEKRKGVANLYISAKLFPFLNSLIIHLGLKIKFLIEITFNDSISLKYV